MKGEKIMRLEPIREKQEIQMKTKKKEKRKKRKMWRRA
jgi:hypothetical protein